MNSFQSEEIEYRVWPDGTVQEEAESPYDWMSDDFMIVVARTEEEAIVKSGMFPNRDRH